jgi:transposase
VRMLDYKFEPEAKAVHRLEFITGTARRRRWSLDDRAGIIAETLAPGAVASQVARLHGVSPQQVFGWRRETRRRAADGAAAPPRFAPVMLEAPMAREPQARLAVIEIVIGDMVVRGPLGVDGATLARVVQVLKAASRLFPRAT